MRAKADALGYPMFIKPVRAGSSYGITKVTGSEQLSAAVELAFQYDDHIILEEAIFGFEVVRFNELRRYLKNVSDKTLSNNLKELETDRLIVRKEYPQIPPKVEYSLSERGKSLMEVLDQLCIWGEKNRQ